MSSTLWSGPEVLNAIKGHGPSKWIAYGVSIDTRTCLLYTSDAADEP
mgnify:CR=1 FL=1